jgi:hypothetical protein
MKRKAPEAWEETERKECGMIAMRGVGNPGFFAQMFEVSERRMAGRRAVYRKRIEMGHACRFYGDGFEAFLSLYLTYERHARAHDKYHHQEHGECFYKRPGS